MRKRRGVFPAMLTACAALALAGSAVAVPLTPVALGPADAPVPLARAGRITDRVGALGDRAPEVRAALDRLSSARRLQLFVVYVSTFAGRSPQDWANAAAVGGGLGRSDLLLAVATHDRRYAVSADQDSGLTQDQLGRVGDQAIAPALRQNDWAGAAIGAAGGYDAVLAGLPITPPVITPGQADPGAARGGGAGALWIPAAALAAAASIGLWAYRRRRRPGGADPDAVPAFVAADPGVRHAVKQPTPLTALPELDAQARGSLVATDDAVRTSREDVRFAAAQCGDAAARPFAEAVDYAADELAAAFRLRQRLDDAFPADDDARRQALDEILSRCTQADRRLDAESEAFDRLRDLAADAPRLLERAEAVLAALPGRIAAAEGALAPLARRYPGSALDPVAGHPAEARDRLDFARISIDQARTVIGTDRGRAAVLVRAAEGALDQANLLAGSVRRRERELMCAERELADALAGADADLAQARALTATAASDGDAPDGDATAHGTAATTDGAAAGGAAGADLTGTADSAHPADDLPGRTARTAAEVAAVRQEIAAGCYDPIAALRRIEEAGSALDAALAGARADPGERRTRALLALALLTARGAVAATRDEVTTHRGAIGSQARTRLAAAERRLRLAESAAAAAPGGDAAAVRGTADGRAYAGGSAAGPGHGGVPPITGRGLGAIGGGPSVRDGLAHARAADRLAREAREFARQDVGGFAGFGGRGAGRRTPAGPDDAAGGDPGGMAGAVLGGILLAGSPGDGPDATAGGSDAFTGPAPGSFGGARTRGRLGGPGG